MVETLPENDRSSAYREALKRVAERPPGWQAIDTAHVLLLAGLVASHKPAKVLELGIGSAYLSRVILSTLESNGVGSLVSVDNFFDWDGVKPTHIKELEADSPAWRVLVEDETAFLHTASKGDFDFIISDGDHTRGYQNAPDVFRICQEGGLMVFHDTRSELFRLLGRLPERVRALGFSSFHFARQSRSDEKTNRGLLVVCKDRRRRFTMDWTARIYLMMRDWLPGWLRPRVRLEKGENGECT